MKITHLMNRLPNNILQVATKCEACGHTSHLFVDRGWTRKMHVIAAKTECPSCQEAK